jgi:hypothetical protein
MLAKLHNLNWDNWLITLLGKKLGRKLHSHLIPNKIQRTRLANKSLSLIKNLKMRQDINNNFYKNWSLFLHKNNIPINQNKKILSSKHQNNNHKSLAKNKLILPIKSNTVPLWYKIPQNFWSKI